MVVDSSGGYYFTDFRYLEDARENLKHLQVFDVKEKGYKYFLQEQQYSEILFEKDLPYYLYEQLCQTNLHLRAADKLLSRLRMSKEHDEICLIKDSVRAVSWAFDSLVQYLRITPYEGMSEWDVVKFLRRRMHELDWEGFSFSPIVAFDENASKPHYSYSRHTRLHRRSSMILVDFGFYHENYASDFTRVIFLQPPSPRWKECYNLLLEAFVLFEEQFSQLETAGEIDLLFRSVLQEAGYDRYFRHATGHGIGLECHEPPSLAPSSNVALHDNMVFTIEPGIYLPGEGGIRIEDMYCIQKGSLEKLTPYPRDMVVL